MFEPNIDRRGRWARAISGCACLAVAALVAADVFTLSKTTRWIVGAALGVLGVFQLFEAWRGWCVARACGLRTPM